MNTGLFLMAPAAAALAAAWCAALDADGAFSNWKNDQQALNQLLRRGLVAPPAGDARKLMAAYGGSLQLGLLPNHLFPSGHLFFIQRALHRLGATPVAVHLTFQNCDQSGKRHRMREGGLRRGGGCGAAAPPHHARLDSEQQAGCGSSTTWRRTFFPPAACCRTSRTCLQS